MLPVCQCHGGIFYPLPGSLLGFTLVLAIQGQPSTTNLLVIDSCRNFNLGNVSTGQHGLLQSTNDSLGGGIAARTIVGIIRRRNGPSFDAIGQNNILPEINKIHVRET